MYRYVKSGDQTGILQAGYWPSYNVPFYEDVFDSLGYSTAVEAYGTEFSYQLCPRAKIFRRDQGKVYMNQEHMKGRSVHLELLKSKVNCSC